MLKLITLLILLPTLLFSQDEGWTKDTTEYNRFEKVFKEADNAFNQKIKIMKENKYYTPLVEEFHTGFFYEELIDGNWIKTKVYLIYDVEFIVDNIRHYCGDKIRVKYLDREDIESLGFIIQSEENPIITSYRAKDYTLYVREDSIRIYKGPYSCEEVLFKGNIKNKSELKRILSQIGYE
jgi:hypothetical protein